LELIVSLFCNIENLLVVADWTRVVDGQMIFQLREERFKCVIIGSKLTVEKLAPSVQFQNTFVVNHVKQVQEIY
jgi:hypothetical protein